MTSTLSPPKVRADEHFVLRNVGWELYEMLLKEIGDRPIHITFDQGSLELMSPLPEHERWKRTIGRLIELLSLERSIPIGSLGSTTFRRKDLAKGLEPDECYYIQHESAVRGKKRIELPDDPPPDLAVEIDITHREIDRESIYAALGVPEIWVFDGQRLSAMVLREGKYRASETSAAFPFLKVGDLERFIGMVEKTDETTVMRAFRDWVRGLK